MNKLILLLGNCLFPDHSKLKPGADDLFFMAEDVGLCSHFKYHKHKLVLFLSAMRSHRDWLLEQWPVEYHEFTPDNQQHSYEEKLDITLKSNPEISEIITYDIEDHFFEERIEQYCLNKGLKLTFVDSPGFLTTKEEFNQYDRGVKRPFMHTFYQRQRKSLNILLKDGEPMGGKWSFDEENRKKLPRGIFLPTLPQVDQTQHTQDVRKIVDELFPDHPGNTDNFFWATTRKDVTHLFEKFLEDRFQQFGPYEDAIDREEVFLFHSVLSPYINMGLITPEEVVKKTLMYADINNIHLPSVEGFIRQIIGWREFIRGIYHEYDGKLQKNHFNHQRKMKPCWYEGTTGIPPLDDSILKAVKYGYTHHIERLMVLGNIMLLCEIHPDEVYKWFMEMYVDSSDWVMAPNVYGMSQYSDGGIFSTKPYIGGSNYILKMSNYPKKGEWTQIINGLYWRFIQVNRSVFEKNPRMSMMTRTLDKMDDQKRFALFNQAEQFIDQVTVLP